MASDTGQTNHGRKIATLFVHGIGGHFQQFMTLPGIAARFGTAETFLLPGHGGTFAALLKTDVEDWLGDVEHRLKRLSDGYDEVILVGHSLGTLLTMYAAYKNPFKVKRLLLWATPFGISVRTSLTQKFRYRREQTPKTGGIAASDILSTDLPTALEAVRMLPKLSRIATFSKRCEIVYPSLPFDFECFQIHYDELVHPVRSTAVLKKNPRAHVHLLTESSHGYLVSPELEHVEDTLIHMLTRAAAG